MLGRIATRLESEGRRLLCSRKTPSSTTSKRMLHAAFWQHGAENIDIWAMAKATLSSGSNTHCEEAHDNQISGCRNWLIQYSGRRTRTTTSGQVNRRPRYASQLPRLGRLTLDFLYPPQAMAIVRKFSPNVLALTTSHIYSKRNFFWYCRRLYSSTTTDDNQDSGEPVSKKAIDDVHEELVEKETIDTVSEEAASKQVLGVQRIYENEIEHKAQERANTKWVLDKLKSDRRRERKKRKLIQQQEIKKARLAERAKAKALRIAQAALVDPTKGDEETRPTTEIPTADTILGSDVKVEAVEHPTLAWRVRDTFKLLETLPRKSPDHTVDQLADLAWELYQRAPRVRLFRVDLANENQRRLLLLGFLDQTTRTTDRERTIQVVSAIEPKKRTSTETRYLVNAYVKLDDTGAAFRALEDQLSLHTNSRHAGVETFVAHQMNKERWHTAIRLLTLVVRHDKLEHVFFSRIVDRLDNIKDALLNLRSSLDGNTDDPTLGRKKADMLDSKSIFREFWKALGKITTAYGEEVSQFKISSKDLVELRTQIGQKWSHRPHDAIIMQLVNEEKWQEALDTFINKYPDQPTQEILSSLLKAAVALRDSRAMQLVFESWFAHNMQPRKADYRLVMADFAERGEAALVEELFHQFVRRFGPSLDIYAILLKSKVKRGEQNAAIFTFEAMSTYDLKPNIICFNILLYGYVHAGDVKGALQHFQRLGSFGIVPDSKTFTSLIYLCASREDVLNTEALFRLARRSKIELPLQMYEMLVMVYVKGRTLTKAQRVVEYVESLYPKGSLTKMWNMLLTEYAVRERIEDINRGFKHMRQAKIAFNEHTFNILIHSLCRLGKLNGARQILGALPREGFQPDAVNYATLMMGYLSKRLYSNIWALYDEMIRAQIPPSWPLQAVLIRTALRQAHEMSTPGQDIVPAAEAILDQATAKLKALDLTSFTPIKSAIPPYLFTSSIFDYAHKDAHEQVEHLEKRFLAVSNMQFPDGAKLNLVTITSLILAKGRSQNWPAVRLYWQQALETAKLDSVRIAYPVHKEKPIFRHTFLLVKPLSAFISAAADGVSSTIPGRITDDDIKPALKAVEKGGFKIDPKNWNDYARFLANAGQIYKACQVVEHRLYNVWKKRKGMLRRAKHWPATKSKGMFYPHWQTLEVMTEALSGLYNKTIGRDTAERNKARVTLQTVKQKCPRTYRSCNRMKDLTAIINRVESSRALKAVRIPYVPELVVDQDRWGRSSGLESYSKLASLSPQPTPQVTSIPKSATPQATNSESGSTTPESSTITLDLPSTEKSELIPLDGEAASLVTTRGKARKSKSKSKLKSSDLTPNVSKPTTKYPQPKSKTLQQKQTSESVDSSETLVPAITQSSDMSGYSVDVGSTVTVAPATVAASNSSRATTLRPDPASRSPSKPRKSENEKGDGDGTKSAPDLTGSALSLYPPSKSDHGSKEK